MAEGTTEGSTSQDAGERIEMQQNKEAENEKAKEKENEQDIEKEQEGTSRKA